MGGAGRLAPPTIFGTEASICAGVTQGVAITRHFLKGGWVSKGSLSCVRFREDEKIQISGHVGLEFPVVSMMIGGGNKLQTW